MVLLSLNLVQWLWSYNQITTWYLHGTYMVPIWYPWGNGFFSISFDLLNMKLIPSEREVKWLSDDIFNHISPTIHPRLIWNMSSESHLTSLSDGINFIFSRSKLMEKNPFPHGYHMGTM